MGKSHVDWLDEVLGRISRRIDIGTYVDDQGEVHLYLGCWSCLHAANRTPAGEPPFKWEVDFHTLEEAIREALKHLDEEHPE